MPALTGSITLTTHSPGQALDDQSIALRKTAGEGSLALAPRAVRDLAPPAPLAWEEDDDEDDDDDVLDDEDDLDLGDEDEDFFEDEEDDDEVEGDEEEAVDEE